MNAQVAVAEKKLKTFDKASANFSEAVDRCGGIPTMHLPSPRTKQERGKLANFFPEFRRPLSSASCTVYVEIVCLFPHHPTILYCICILCHIANLQVVGEWRMKCEDLATEVDASQRECRNQR